MAATTRKTAGAKSPARQTSDLGPLFEEGSAGLTAFVQANQAIMNGMASLSSEMLAFGTRRLRENLERSDSLAGCQSPEEAFQVQCDFFESATRQYLDQASNVMSIMASMTRDAWAPLQAQTHETLRTLNKAPKGD